jgi:XFP N-terminal domain
VLRTPKGWTGPKEVDRHPAEGTFRSHQVPMTDTATNLAHLAQLEEWLRSYHPEEQGLDLDRLRREATWSGPPRRRPGSQRRDPCRRPQLLLRAHRPGGRRPVHRYSPGDACSPVSRIGSHARQRRCWRPDNGWPRTPVDERVRCDRGAVGGEAIRFPGSGGCARPVLGRPPTIRSREPRLAGAAAVDPCR